jgi:hypothetical protein
MARSKRTNMLRISVAIAFALASAAGCGRQILVQCPDEQYAVARMSFDGVGDDAVDEEAAWAAESALGVRVTADSVRIEELYRDSITGHRNDAPIDPSTGCVLDPWGRYAIDGMDGLVRLEDDGTVTIDYTSTAGFAYVVTYDVTGCAYEDQSWCPS